MTDYSDIFASSALVVAHPDDEVLWFSSVVGRVSRVVVCYEDCADLPELGPGRRRVTQDHPLSTMVWLRRPEPGSMNRVDWSRPLQTSSGLAFNAGSDANNGAREQAYRSSYATLRADLGKALRGTANVFTHNLWGEYGHADHVQVARVVTSLAQELGFRLRYSSYISPRSMPLAAQVLPRLVSDLRLPTDRALAARIQGVYEDCKCWTWHPSYEPPAEESFLVVTEDPPTEASSVPLHCVMTL